MKFDHKELFLYDTYSRIEGVVGPDRAAQVYGELSEHIDDHQQELEGRGLPSDLAQHAAIKAMGTPQQIAVEFARHSVSRPWKGAYVWLALMVLAVIFTPLDSSSRWSLVPGASILALFLAFQAARNGSMFPKKLLIGGALFAVAAGAFVESRMVHVYSIRMPYSQGHRTLLSMRSQNLQFLETETAVASNLKKIKSQLATVQKGVTGKVKLQFLDYSLNLNYLPVIVWMDTPVGYKMVPTLAEREYSLALATEAIDEKLGKIGYEQAQRRSKLGAIEAQIMTPALARAVFSLPFKISAAAVIFGTVAFLTYGAGQFGVLRRTRRRQIWS
ncbi:MAG TPA: hypothetical protein VK171_09275 [Fimbriimonas sp.]|nr:hypothetical protein [Fimbriimonas sp.]